MSSSALLVIFKRHRDNVDVVFKKKEKRVFAV